MHRSRHVPLIAAVLGIAMMSAAATASAGVSINGGASSWDDPAGATATIKVTGATPGNKLTITICGGNPPAVKQVARGVADLNGDATFNLTPVGPAIFASGDKISVVESNPPPGGIASRSKGSFIGAGAVANNGDCGPLGPQFRGGSGGTLQSECTACDAPGLPGQSPGSLALLLAGIAGIGCLALRGHHGTRTV